MGEYAGRAERGQFFRNPANDASVTIGDGGWYGELTTIFNHRTNGVGNVRPLFSTVFSFEIFLIFLVCTCVRERECPGRGRGDRGQKIVSNCCDDGTPSV